MKKALLVGINLYQGSPLRGCVNDVTQMSNYLQSLHYDNISLCVDAQATTSNIRSMLHNFTTNCASGDSLFFHYSGHGSQVPCRNGSEEDGLTEIICPVDINFNYGSYITDDELRGIFASIPDNVHLEVVLDCCHSGTGLRDINVSNRFLQPPENCIDHERITTREVVSVKNSINTVLWAACRSNETAADANVGGTFNGAFTWSLLNSIESKTRFELEQLITNTMVSRGWGQHAQLECSSDHLQRAFLSTL